MKGRERITGIHGTVQSQAQNTREVGIHPITDPDVHVGSAEGGIVPSLVVKNPDPDQPSTQYKGLNP